MLKNKVFIGILAIFLILIIIHNIKFFSQRRGKTNSPSGEETRDIIAPPRERKESPPAGKKEPLSPFWGRNPFLLPGEIKLGRSVFLTIPSDKEEVMNVIRKQQKGEQEWSLTAIIYQKTGSRRAIINHEIVQENDTLPGEETKVLKIMPNRVILTRAGKTFSIELKNQASGKDKAGEKQEK